MRAIKVTAHYFCYPLWEYSPDRAGDINPDGLLISEKLKRQLMDWAKVFEQGLDMEDPRNSIGMTAEENDRFHEQGRALAMELQRELGPSYAVRYWK